MPLNKSWYDYSESLIERGRVLIDVSFLKEIEKMNSSILFNYETFGLSAFFLALSIPIDISKNDSIVLPTLSQKNPSFAIEEIWLQQNKV
ncbi:MAG: hypothetical protein WCC17_01940 [Candidatus Nitrosopolaris sp.]|jgi:hypothetical protein